MIITILDFCLATMVTFIRLEKNWFIKPKKQIRNINIPIDLQLKLFDALVYPILTYSADIWGFENKIIIGKIHLQFCKKILGVRTSTPNFMVYRELGRYPI